MNWRRKFLTCVLCANLLLQGSAAVAAVPVCTNHDAAIAAATTTVMPAPHHVQHAAAMHSVDAATTLHAGHRHAQPGNCECDQDCGGSCALHVPGQLLPGDLFALSAPRHDAFPLHTDERPYPTVVAPRLRPPTPS